MIDILTLVVATVGATLSAVLSFRVMTRPPPRRKADPHGRPREALIAGAAPDEPEPARIHDAADLIWPAAKVADALDAAGDWRAYDVRARGGAYRITFDPTQNSRNRGTDSADTAQKERQ